MRVVWIFFKCFFCVWDWILADEMNISRGFLNFSHDTHS